eukprot:GDKI01021112.1.p1 GENE.GDKI01021112.1~~GDKI01021112.1.p1  ORF type:complete len:302 (+),score=79.00 GDKI01021112.1:53-907(+)
MHKIKMTDTCVRLNTNRHTHTHTHQCEREFVTLEKRDNAVAIVRLNRPKQLNALCTQLCTELTGLLKELDTDDSVRCVIITGAGDKAFAAGADIKEMQDHNWSSCQNTNLLAGWDDMLKIRKPLIAAVNGFALGGGCEVAMMCDIILASDKAEFGQPEILIGTIPGMGASQRMTRAVGKSKAMEWMLTGRRIKADEAERAGLVSRVVPHAELLHEAIKMAESIAKFSNPILMACKDVINRAFETTLSEGIQYERRVFHGTFSSHDRKEGMTAFVEKRPAQWQHK